MYIDLPIFKMGTVTCPLNKEIKALPQYKGKPVEQSLYLETVQQPQEEKKRGGGGLSKLKVNKADITSTAALQ